MNEVIKTKQAIIELEDIGKIIRKERMKQNLSIQQISETLRINEKFLKGIEDGQIDGTMATVFIHGFIRSYAQHLNVLNDDLDRFLRKSSDVNIETIKPSFSKKGETFGTKSSLRSYFPLLLIILAFFISYFIWSGTEDGKENFIAEQKIVSSDEVFFQDSSDSLNPDQEEDRMDSYSTKFIEDQSTIDIPEIKPNKRGEAQFETDYSGNLVEDEIPMKSFQRQPSTETISLDSVEEILTKIGKEALNPLPPPPPMQLILTSTERTWVAVSMDKQEVVDIMLDAGESYQVAANDRFHITMGNTASLHVMLDGREIEFDRSKSLLSDWVIDSNP